MSSGIIPATKALTKNTRLSYALILMGRKRVTVGFQNGLFPPVGLNPDNQFDQVYSFINERISHGASHGQKAFSGKATIKISLAALLKPVLPTSKYSFHYCFKANS